MIKSNKSEKIIQDIQQYLIKLARQNDFEWFYNLHQLEMVKSSELLLNYYPKADRQIVIISCWLHDIVQYTAKNETEAAAVKGTHHIAGAEMAEEFLSKYDLDRVEIDRIKRCIQRHRNREGFRPEAIEEKIVASADALSHFYSVFFLTFFKFHPSLSIDEMVKVEKEKLDRDWNDVNILPEAGKIVKNRYEVLKSMIHSYQSSYKE